MKVVRITYVVTVGKIFWASIFWDITQGDPSVSPSHPFELIINQALVSSNYSNKHHITLSCAHVLEPLHLTQDLCVPPRMSLFYSLFSILCRLS